MTDQPSVTPTSPVYYEASVTPLPDEPVVIPGELTSGTLSAAELEYLVRRLVREVASLRTQLVARGLVG